MSNESCPFSEHYLHIIWNEQMLSPRLRTVSGQELQVVSPGLWNHGAGPDFRNAVLLLEGETLKGDVELHRVEADWQRHGHDSDRAYDNVVLHVVWAASTECGTGRETLELKTHLQAGISDVLAAVRYAFYPYASQVPPGACSMRWALAEDGALQRVLREAGCGRCRRRGQELLARCRETLPSQVLYEALFDGLGYANNRAQFRRLAQALPLAELLEHPQEERPALLFGTAGLLTDPTMSEVLPEMAEVLREYWRIWWRSGRTSVAIEWNRGGGRPMNSVHRRLMAGVQWLERCGYDPMRWLQSTTRGDYVPKEMLKAVLAPPSSGDTLWQGVRDFGHRLSPPAELLGRERLCDLALNTWLPFAWAQATACGDAGRAGRAGRILECWQMLPRGQENAILKAAAHRFLSPPSRASSILKCAAQQQGLMDIFKTFCLALNHNCGECPFVVEERNQRPQRD